MPATKPSASWCWRSPDNRTLEDAVTMVGEVVESEAIMPSTDSEKGPSPNRHNPQRPATERPWIQEVHVLPGSPGEPIEKFRRPSGSRGHVEQAKAEGITHNLIAPFVPAVAFDDLIHELAKLAVITGFLYVMSYRLQGHSTKALKLAERIQVAASEVAKDFSEPGKNVLRFQPEELVQLVVVWSEQVPKTRRIVS
jgi:hypothetical protein